jgi:hypothetical protein
MKIYKSKKGVETITELIPWILFLMALAGVGIFLGKMTYSSIADASKIHPDLEDETLIMGRFFNSGDCFAYTDDAGRVHSKLIDASKFKQDVLDNTCFPDNNVNFAYHLSLESPLFGEGPIFTFGTVPISTFNWHSGGFENKLIVEKVAVLFNEKVFNGELTIKVKNAQ